MDKRVAVYRKEHFNAAHRLFNPAWNNEDNARVFGKCSNPNYHGHNYELVVKITGAHAADTGFVIDLKELSDIVKENVLNKMDHKNLNLDVPEFKNVNPTVENISIIIYELLRKKINSNLDLLVRVYETPRNFAEYPVE